MEAISAEQLTNLCEEALAEVAKEVRAQCTMQLSFTKKGN